MLDVLCAVFENVVIDKQVTQCELCIKIFSTIEAQHIIAAEHTRHTLIVAKNVIDKHAMSSQLGVGRL